MSSPTAAPIDPVSVAYGAPIRRSGVAALLHRIFGASLLLKGLYAAAEVGAGLALWAIGSARILAFVTGLTTRGAAEDPQGPLAHAALWIARMLPLDTHHFVEIYLVAHGAVKIAIVVGLMRRIPWVYPTGMAVIGAFVAYQMWYFVVAPSAGLLLLSGLDALIVALIWREWREMSA